MKPARYPALLAACIMAALYDQGKGERCKHAQDALAAWCEADGGRVLFEGGTMTLFVESVAAGECERAAESIGAEVEGGPAIDGKRVLVVMLTTAQGAG